MRRVLPMVIMAVAAYAADDPWAKVRELKSGTELRIYTIGVKQPVMAKLDEARDDSLVVVLKNEQMAIAKEEIERIDFRPAGSGRRLKGETKTTREPTDQKPVVIPGQPKTPPGSRSSTSSGISITSGPGFETIYRRQATTAPKAQK